MLWLRTLLFTILIPGTVLVLLPLALVASGLGPHFDFGSASYSGLVPLLAGLSVIVACFIDFVRRGRGTPAPYDPRASWSSPAFIATSATRSTWVWYWLWSAKRC